MAIFSMPPLGPAWQLQALVARTRFSNTVQREVIGILEDAYRAVAKRLSAESHIGARERLRLEAIFTEIRSLLSEAYGTAQARVTPLLREYAALEAEIAARQARVLAAVTRAVIETPPGVLGGTVGAPAGMRVVVSGVPRSIVVAAAQFADIVDRIDIGGIGWGDWWIKAKNDGILRTRRIVQQGVVQGLNPRDIARQVFATSKVPGPNAWRGSRQVAITATRTMVTAIQSQAVLAQVDQYSDVVNELRFEAILDARTCLVAGSLLQTPTGLRTIENIAQGDEVIGGSGETRRVVATKRASTKRLAIVRLSNGETIRCTPDHRFLTKDGRWIEAQHLQSDTALAQPGDQ